MDHLNEGVSDYLAVMQNQGAKAAYKSAEANPNSVMSMLYKELIEYYKLNQAKARSILNDNPNKQFHSNEHRMHYQCADIAINGYSKPTTNVNSSLPVDMNRATEMDKLNRAGWKPLNEQSSGPQLLNG